MKSVKFAMPMKEINVTSLTYSEVHGMFDDSILHGLSSIDLLAGGTWIHARAI
jgi:hypothetical protein